jgi:hypothetical protein
MFKKGFIWRRGTYQVDVHLVYNGNQAQVELCCVDPLVWVAYHGVFIEMFGPGPFMADNDDGEMFLNYSLHQQSLSELCRVLGLMYGFSSKGGDKMRVQQVHHGLEVIPLRYGAGCDGGPKIDSGKHRGRDKNILVGGVVVNCPGSPKYNLALP